ncbi:prolyl oligopeptidase family serine peptidase [uncultured Prevotella sp.]|uniref:carboxylesterase family protein n=1 Tax=uncultured Prevotella sp. TaxID=159272 RepID=UPI0027E2495C|nr:prolyl oligopeptidase family serine peptidase [uncultured Prevotella sp.]
MKVIIIFISFVFMFCSGDIAAQNIIFSKETFSLGGTTIPYRKASTPGPGDKAALVVYLHGGSSKGNDNVTQMNEPGINSISSWLANNNRKAIMIVPQCPKDRSWLGTMLATVKQLMQTFIDRGVADEAQVYIFGGSMGGTGTWNMLANYPEFFAAAMPVAGNPTGLDAEKVAQTPLYTVMGTADVIMKIPNVKTFLAEMDEWNAEYQFDIEDGWTHEDTCKKSYTDTRLEWVFGHTRGDESGITTVDASDTGIVASTWYTLDGQQFSTQPTKCGLYIKKSLTVSGCSVTQKVVVK